MRSLRSLLLLFLFCLHVTANEQKFDLFSSSDELKKLFTKEKVIKAKLETYLQHLEKQISTLDNLLNNTYKVGFGYLKGSFPAEEKNALSIALIYPTTDMKIRHYISVKRNPNKNGSR